MKVLTVIPSRIGSTRLLRKPLIKIADKTLIHWVWGGVSKSKLSDKIIVATDSEEIKKEVESFGGEAMMTSPNHQTGSDRVAEVAEKMPEYEIIINVQGDNILKGGTMIDDLISSLTNNPEIQMAVLKSEIKDKKELKDPSVSKIITDKNNFALYFSRYPIPYNRDNLNIKYYKNKGIYGFRRETLLKYAQLPQGELEKAESLEQLRALENGIKIYGLETKEETFEINLAKDIKKLWT